MVDIIRVNQRLKESKEAGTPPLIVQDLVDLLQYLPVSKMIDGLTVTGGTGNACKINHSGLAVAGSYPSKIKSSSMI